MKTLLWLIGNILAIIIGYAMFNEYGKAAGMFAWFVCAALADIRESVEKRP